MWQDAQWQHVLPRCSVPVYTQPNPTINSKPCTLAWNIHACFEPAHLQELHLIAQYKAAMFPETSCPSLAFLHQDGPIW